MTATKSAEFERSEKAFKRLEKEIEGAFNHYKDRQRLAPPMSNAKASRFLFFLRALTITVLFIAIVGALGYFLPSPEARAKHEAEIKAYQQECETFRGYHGYAARGCRDYRTPHHP